MPNAEFYFLSLPLALGENTLALPNQMEISKYVGEYGSQKLNRTKAGNTTFFLGSHTCQVRKIFGILDLVSPCPHLATELHYKIHPTSITSLAFWGSHLPHPPAQSVCNICMDPSQFVHSLKRLPCQSGRDTKCPFRRSPKTNPTLSLSATLNDSPCHFIFQEHMHARSAD